jgi:hypothetical protein
MTYNSLSQLAFCMHREAGRHGGVVSIPLANVRGVLRHTLKYGWGPPATETHSIACFARDFGFEYLSLTLNNGYPVCNFWLMPDACA